MKPALVLLAASLIALAASPPTSAVAPLDAQASEPCTLTMCGRYDDGEHVIEFGCDIHTTPSGNEVQFAVTAFTAVLTHPRVSRTIASCEVDYDRLHWVHAHSDVPLLPLAGATAVDTLPAAGPIKICSGISVWFLDGHHVYFYIGFGGVCDLAD